MGRRRVRVSNEFLTSALRGTMPAWTTTNAPSDLQIVGFDLTRMKKGGQLVLIVESEQFSNLEIPGHAEANFSYSSGPMRVPYADPSPVVTPDAESPPEKPN